MAVETQEKFDVHNVEDIYPLSPMQQGMLFHTIYEPGSGVYVSLSIHGIKGKLDVDAWERAWQRIAKRHSILRTSFLWEDLEKPVQVVRKSVPVKLELLDWRTKAEAQKQRFEELIHSVRVTGFQLQRAPLMRLLLIQFADESYKFIFAWHHLLLDRWSRSVVMNEVIAAYECFARGDDFVADEPKPYSAYIDWLSQQDLKVAQGFWKEYLADVEPSQPLPIDRQSQDSPDAGKEYQYERLRLSKADTELLKQFARDNKLTFNSVVQGAWALLLARYLNSGDVTIGMTVSGRPPELPGVESMVGLFINTLPLRVKVPEAATLLEWLREVQDQQLRVQEYASNSLLDIQAWAKLPRGVQIFENILAFENITVRNTFEADRQTLFQAEGGFGSTGYPLTLGIVPNEELTINITYDCARFERESIQRMLGHLQVILTSFGADPDRQVCDVPLLTDDETRQLLLDWNDTTPQYERDLSTHELFERQAALAPEQVAIISQVGSVTYADLNARANQLAHHLRQCGARAGMPIGVCMDRSPEFIISALAILKAGSVYVPLDPTYPSERLAFMIRDTGSRLVLTLEPFAKVVTEAGHAKVICLDRERASIDEHCDANPNVQATGDSPAYIIYTSGSTGTPKGIVIPHRAINRLVRSSNYVKLNQEDRVAHASNNSFDAATFEIWGPLLNGASLVVIDRDVMLSPPQFAHFIREQGITTLFLTTALFNQVARDVSGAFSGLKHLMFGGEAVDPTSVRSVLENGSPQRLMHVYGPTESTTFSNWHLITTVPAGATNVPIGGPVSNTQAYVLDQHLRPVPSGVLGELHLGGDGLAHCYHDRPDLTAEKFIPNPFYDGQIQTSNRLYKTGDLVRWLPGGAIEFIGRNDDQVKIRGFRVELGEIESVLNRHPAVNQSVVIARKEAVSTNAASVTRLVAYIVCRDGVVPTVAELRNFVTASLPEYMAPAAIVVMDALPITPNGKVNRRELPDPDRSAFDERQSYVAPRNGVEDALAEIWSEILGLDKVGVHDNFFELGGDSILCIRIVSRANKSGLGITPKQIFQNQTIAELAAVVGSARFVSSEQDVVSGPVPLTPIQHWFFEQDLKEINYFNQAAVFELPNSVDLKLLRQVCRALVLQHDALRLRFARTENTWRQFNAPDDCANVELVDLSIVAESERNASLRKHILAAHRSLNLSDGPLLRMIRFELGPEKAAQLFIVVHHLAIDGVSWRILLEDLQTATEQALAGEPIKLPAKTTSFKTWSEKLERYAESDNVAGELSYWLAPERTDVSCLPRDLPSDENTRAASGEVSVALTVADTEALLQHLPAEYGTQINDALLTALGFALSKWTGGVRFLVDLEGHGREEIVEGVDLSRTVGWFTTIYPIWLDVSRDANRVSTLKSIKEQLNKVPDRGIGYGVLRYLRRDASLAQKLRQLPPSEISFNYLGQFGQERAKSMFTPSALNVGPMYSPQQQRRHLLNVVASVEAGCLRIHWNYGTKIHRRETIENLAQAFIKELQLLIAAGQAGETARYVPSDFPLARLNQARLDKLASKIK